MDSMEIEMKSSFKTVVSYLDSIENEIAEIKVALDKKLTKTIWTRWNKEFCALKLSLANAKNKLPPRKVDHSNSILSRLAGVGKWGMMEKYKIRFFISR
jgi:hypothetical protein